MVHLFIRLRYVCKYNNVEENVAKTLWMLIQFISFLYVNGPILGAKILYLEENLFV